MSWIRNAVQNDTAYQCVECHLRDGLAIVLGGHVEVPTRYGTADVVTSHHVYEVKLVRDWKHAVGKAIVYAQALGLKPGIALFGLRPSGEQIQNIGELCKGLGIDCLFHFLFEESKSTGDGMLCPLPIPDGLPDISFDFRIPKKGQSRYGSFYQAGAELQAKTNGTRRDGTGP